MPFKVQIDWDADGSFSGYDDITAYVKAVRLQLGISDPTSRIAEIGQCTLVLNNADKRFSPLNSSSPYYGKMLPNRPIVVQEIGASTWTLFRGVTRSFSVMSGAHGLREAQIAAEDQLSVLQNFMLSLPLQENKNAGTLVELITAQVFAGGTATANVFFNGTPANNDTLSVNEVVYTFKTTLTTAAHEVKIDGRDGTIDNLVAAINNAEGVGTRYASGTARPSGITAEPIQSYWRAVRADAPIRYYRLNETSGTTAADSGVNGQSGTYVGGCTLSASGASGDGDTAVTFNGSTGHVVLPPLEFKNRSFSVEAWIAPSASSPPAQQGWFSVYKSSAPGEHFLCRLNSDGSVRIGWNGSDLVTSAGVISFGVYSHVVVVYNYYADTTRLYVNGSLIASNSGGPFTADAPTMNIGRAAYGSEYFKGTIDEVAVYFTALSATRVQAHYFSTVTPGVLLRANARGAWANTLPLAKSSAAISLPSSALSGGSDAPALRSYDQGQLSFDIAADQWTADHTNALSAVGACVDSEWGMFWQARNGTLVFKNRDYLLTRVGAPVALTLSSQHNAVESALGIEAVYNRVSVSYTPRAALTTGVIARATGVITVPGQSGTERWNGTVVLPGGGSVTVKLPFVDPATGKVMGARSIITPLAPGTDYKASDAPDGLSGFDYTGWAGLTFSAVINGGDVEVTIRNTALGPLYVAELKVRGVGIVGYNQQQIVREDAASQAAYGVRDLTVNLPLGTNQYFAESLAEYLLNRFKTPTYRLNALTFNGQTAVGAASLYALEIGDVLAVSDAQIGGGSQKYLITGVAYELGPGVQPRTTLHVRLLDDALYAMWDSLSHGFWDVHLWGI